MLRKSFWPISSLTCRNDQQHFPTTVQESQKTQDDAAAAAVQSLTAVEFEVSAGQ